MLSRKRAQSLLASMVNLHRPFDETNGCVGLLVDVHGAMSMGLLPNVALLTIYADEYERLVATIDYEDECAEEACAALNEYFGEPWRFQPRGEPIPGRINCGAAVV